MCCILDSTIHASQHRGHRHCSVPSHMGSGKLCHQLCGKSTLHSHVVFLFDLGALQRKKFKKPRDYYGSGWVGPGLTRNGFFGESSQNSPIPVLIYWSSIPCVFCLYIGWGGEWVGWAASNFFWDFFNFANPLIPSSGIIGICLECPRPLPSVFLYPPLTKNVKVCSYNIVWYPVQWTIFKNYLLSMRVLNYVPGKLYFYHNVVAHSDI